MTPLLLLLTVHFVADFVLQSNWMALGKSKSWWPLLAHTSIYSACFIVPVAVFGPPWTFVLVTFLTHTATDYVTSRLTSKLWFIKTLFAGRPFKDWGDLYSVETDDAKRHWFFVAIGFDQLIHVWTLALTYQWLVAPPQP